MPNLYFFNPGHELDILGGKSHYTPPYTIQKMAVDLEMLPVWYGGGGSFTLVRNVKASQFVAAQPKCFRARLSSPMILSLMMKELFRCIKQNIPPKLPPLTARIWGLSPRSIDLLLDFKRNGMNIDVPEWNDVYAELTKRQTGALCLTRLEEIFPVELGIKVPEFFSDIEGVQSYVAKNKPPYVIKLPLSSSGRGLYWLNDSTIDARANTWIAGALKRQGAIGIEPALNKVLDFAAEFYSDGKGNVRYEGLSIFETQEKGQFVGCMLNTQEALLQRLNEYIAPEDYMFLVEQVRSVLQEIVGNLYDGYLGVDMLIYKDNDGNYAVHPFVELNMRSTLGLAAMKISKQFLHPASQGMLRIKYHVYNAEKEHQRMLEESPLKIEDNMIRSGYLSLCPVTTETHYLATVHVFE
jgi:hypothetical protein